MILVKKKPFRMNHLKRSRQGEEDKQEGEPVEKRAHCTCHSEQSRKRSREGDDELTEVQKKMKIIKTIAEKFPQLVPHMTDRHGHYSGLLVCEVADRLMRFYFKDPWNRDNEVIIKNYTDSRCMATCSDLILSATPAAINNLFSKGYSNMSAPTGTIEEGNYRLYHQHWGHPY